MVRLSRKMQGSSASFMPIARTRSYNEIYDGIKAIAEGHSDSTDNNNDPWLFDAQSPVGLRDDPLGFGNPGGDASWPSSPAGSTSNAGESAISGAPSPVPPASSPSPSSPASTPSQQASPKSCKKIPLVYEDWPEYVVKLPCKKFHAYIKEHKLSPQQVKDLKRVRRREQGKLAARKLRQRAAEKKRAELQMAGKQLPVVSSTTDRKKRVCTKAQRRTSTSPSSSSSSPSWASASASPAESSTIGETADTFNSALSYSPEVEQSLSSSPNPFHYFEK